MDILTTSPAMAYVLPRRFDAVEWFARLQLYRPEFLNSIAVDIPTSGPSRILVPSTFSGSIPGLERPHVYDKVASTMGPAHAQYIESFLAWQARSHGNFGTLSISWILSLNREAWFSWMKLHLPLSNAYVKSSWITLALTTFDIELLRNFEESDLQAMHSRVYYEAFLRGLDCTSMYAPMSDWMAALQSHPVWKIIHAQLSPLLREKLGVASD